MTKQWENPGPNATNCPHCGGVIYATTAHIKWDGKTVINSGDDYEMERQCPHCHKWA